MAVQPRLCRTWSETPKTGFLTTRLISQQSSLCLTCSETCKTHFLAHLTYSPHKEKKNFFLFLCYHMAFFLGEMVILSEFHVSIVLILPRNFTTKFIFSRLQKVNLILPIPKMVFAEKCSMNSQCRETP